MNFNFYGDENNQKLLIISPIFSNDDSFEDIIRLFSDYYIIMPDLTNKEDEFKSFKKDALSIEDFLLDKGIEEIDYGIGFSYGSNIFLNLISYKKINFKNVTLDGTITFKLNKFIRKALAMKLKSYRIDFMRGNVDTEKIDDRFPGMYEIFKDIVSNLDDNSIKNIVNESLNFTMPPLPYENRIKFVFGESDPNFKNSKRISKNYPDAKILKVKGCTHVNFIFQKPGKFLEIMMR